MSPEDGTYPYRVSVLSDLGTVDRKIFNCKTFLGAWWLIGQYRSAGFTVYLERYDNGQQRFQYLHSLRLTEY